MDCAIVTGASGFLGRHIVSELLESTYDVIAVVSSDRSASDVAACFPRVRVVVCGYEGYPDLADLCGTVKDGLFFHFAWAGVSGPMLHDADVQIKNIAATVDAVRAASDMGCSRFIGAGSVAELECLYEMEGSEGSHIAADYKTAKLAAGYMARMEAKRLGISLVWPRLINAYGEGDLSARLVNSLIRKLQKGEKPKLSSGTQLYNFMYVDDAVRAFRLIAERGKDDVQYMVGTRCVRPLKNFLYEIGKIVAPNVELEFGALGDSGTHLNGYDLISEELFDEVGFVPEISFEEGIRRTAQWLAKHEDDAPSGC